MSTVCKDSTNPIKVTPVCDLCKIKVAKYNCKTSDGPWGNLCEECFRIRCMELDLVLEVL